MSERIVRWNVPFDSEPHEIGWGPICFFSISAGWLGRVYTLETEDVAETGRSVQLFQTGDVLPEISEHLCSAEGPGGAVLHLVAVNEGMEGGGEHTNYFSTSVTIPEGTLHVSIVPDPAVHPGRDYSKVLFGGIDHMRFLLDTGVED